MKLSLSYQTLLYNLTTSLPPLYSKQNATLIYIYIKKYTVVKLIFLESIALVALFALFNTDVVDAISGILTPLHVLRQQGHDKPDEQRYTKAHVHRNIPVHLEQPTHYQNEDNPVNVISHVQNSRRYPLGFRIRVFRAHFVS